MAQFDVHENVGRNTRSFPYLVVVQNSRMRHLPGRVVIPLRLARDGDAGLPTVVEVCGVAHVLLAYSIFTISRRRVGPVVDSLADRDSQIIFAIDEVITTAYG